MHTKQDFYLPHILPQREHRIQPCPVYWDSAMLTWIDHGAGNIIVAFIRKAGSDDMILRIKSSI